MTVDIENFPVFRLFLCLQPVLSIPGNQHSLPQRGHFRQELPQISLPGSFSQDGLSGCVAASAFPECRQWLFVDFQPGR